MSELSNANETLRAQLSENERDLSALRATISSLESTLSSAVARETADMSGTPSALDAPGSDQGQDRVGETLHRIACQLIADGEELDALGNTVDQVDAIFIF